MGVGTVLQILGYAAAISLQVLILRAMSRGSWRRYPLVFLNVVVDLLTNLIEIKPNLTQHSLSGPDRRQWILLYYWDERIVQAALFILVISLIYRASTDVRPRRVLLVGLVGGSLIFSLASMAILYDANVTLSKWMTPWTRNMYFCAAILDLLLWATLIRTRQRDQKLLMISGGLGLQFTAGAIGWALRDISRGSIDFSTILIISGNLSCLYIWWHALRVPPRDASGTHSARTLPVATKSWPK